MILLCTNWLYAQACQHHFCAHDIPSDKLLHSQDGDMYALLNQVEKAMLEAKSNNPLDVLVIDPGHGGRDKGCSGASAIEKNITLALSKQLKQLIENQLPEIKVILTRERDKFISLKRRADIANENKADIFISIHCNYIRNASHLRGSETFVLGMEEDDTQSEKIASRENSSITLEESYKEKYSGFDPLSPESYIMFSMIQNLHLDNSIVLASFAEDELVKRTKVKSKGVKQGAFVVLKEANMPSILVETGYLSNEKDERLLTSSEGQNEIIQGLFNAIIGYKQFID